MRLLTARMSLILAFLCIFTLSSVHGAHDYKDALYLSTYFFGANRCGDTKSWLHGACHTRDGEDGKGNNIDLSGGWHDCGDHVKFAQTNTYSACLLLQSYLRFQDSFEDRYSQDFSKPPANGIADVLDEVKIFTDYLIKAIINARVYYQIGNATDDHNSVCIPEDQEGQSAGEGGYPRDLYSVTSGASNYCGGAAAALAMMYRAYKDHDSAYAESCLNKAIEYYNVGKINPSAIGDQAGNAYEGECWADDMTLAAQQLYLATNIDSYWNDAKNYRNIEEIMPTYFVMDYGNISPVAYYEMYKDKKSMLDLYTKLKAEYRCMVDSTTSSMSRYGYAFFSEWGSLKYAAAAAYIAFLYADIENDFGNTLIAKEAISWGKKNLDFILGTHTNIASDASTNYSFLIGYDNLGGGYPSQPHHSAAFGYHANEASFYNWNDARQPNRHVLTGALVGGPTSPGGGYEDERSNAYSSEVCIYYNAPLVAALGAFIALTDGDTTTDTTIIDTTIDTTSTLTGNLLEYMGWQVIYDAHGSTGSLDTSNIHNNDGYVSASLDICATNEAAKEYAYGQLTGTMDTSLIDATKIKIVYKSDTPLFLALDQPPLGDLGESYQVSLATSSTWRTIELALTEAVFAQPTWVQDPTALDISLVESISLMPQNDNQSAEIDVSVVVFENYVGFNNPVLLCKKEVLPKGISVKGVSRQMLKLGITSSGNYLITIHAINGRLIKTIQTIFMRPGYKDISLKSANINCGMYLLSVSGNNSKITQKIIVK